MSETTTNNQTGATLGEPTQAAEAADDITTRLRPIFTEEGLARIQGSRVLVIGLGGVGSSCVEALARACVGELFLVDRDTVDASNLNRQALAFESTVGRVKADVMREMVREINPRCRVECRQSYVTKESLPEVLAWARWLAEEGSTTWWTPSTRSRRRSSSPASRGARTSPR